MDKLRRTLQWQIEETTPLIKVVNIRNMESSEGERTPATNGNVKIGPREDTTQPESPKEHLIAYRFFDQHRFASKRALVKCSITSRDDDTIRRRRNAVLNADDVADFENVLVLALDVRALFNVEFGRTEDGFYSDGISRDE
jgi:hypothetical protein